MSHVSVEVVLADPIRPLQRTLEVQEGTTVEQAILASELTLRPEEFITAIYAKRCRLSDIVKDQDRIELTFPVKKQATDKRFTKVKAQKT